MNRYDAVVVGAGPYGLSTAAHLHARGLAVATFGKPLGMWRDHMPRGMNLRSQWWASNLWDPRQDLSFARFFKESRHREGHPLPVEAFIEYGLWFQQRAVPDVDQTLIRSIARRNGGFVVRLEDGRELESRSVVMAIGLYYYAYRPEPYVGLPDEMVSHSSTYSDYSRFRERSVLVIGGGQSAIEYAALLHEAGARVQVVSRREIMWLDPDRGRLRPLLERVRYPSASVAPGWKNWWLDRTPYAFYRLPQSYKDSWNSDYRSGASDWLHDRVVGKVALREGQTVVKAVPAGRQVEATLSTGEVVRADHVMLATGYRVDVNRLAMLEPALRSSVRADQNIPLLSSRFESTVPGLFFVGITSLRAFGPLYRFVAGCGAAARRVAGAIDAKGRIS